MYCSNCNLVTEITVTEIITGSVIAVTVIAVIAILRMFIFRSSLNTASSRNVLKKKSINIIVKLFIIYKIY